MDSQDGRDGFPFDHWQFDGDTLTISADNSNETLTPGQPLSLSIHARGRTTSPTACTFNGATCPTLRVPQPNPQPQQRQQFQPQVQQSLQQAAPNQSPAQFSPSQAAPSSPQTTTSSPQLQQPSPQDQPSQDRPQRDQRSWQNDRQPSLWDRSFPSWR